MIINYRRRTIPSNFLPIKLWTAPKTYRIKIFTAHTYRYAVCVLNFVKSKTNNSSHCSKFQDIHSFIRNATRLLQNSVKKKLPTKSLINCANSVSHSDSTMLQYDFFYMQLIMHIVFSSSLFDMKKMLRFDLIWFA